MSDRVANGDASWSDHGQNGSTRAVLYLRVSTKEQAGRGGEIEGYSIPTQRLAAKSKAEALGAAVVAEFVDAGESAKSADRPQLQAMLRFIQEEPVQFLIVHKIDRLARNMLDNLMISVALEQAGVSLVSCSEQIDSSPSGKLTYGLMALIAEWYSNNLGQEVRTKTLQKVRSGGTPRKAAIGYLNVRKRELGHEIRTVEIDSERAPLVRWAFEAYATGDWSVKKLTAALEERGLTTVPTLQWCEKPLNESGVHRMLRNRYYLGKVIWQGIEYEGKHPPLITATVFQRVQDIIDSHRAGEKQRVHPHYLKGSVWCATCGSRLCISKHVNRFGSQYAYFMCVGRHQKRTDCTQRYLPLELVESHIEEKWRNVRIDPEYADLLRELIMSEVQTRQAAAERDRNIARRRIQSLVEKQKKLLDAHYANAIPLDLLKSEQDRIADELAAAEALLAASQMTFDTIEANLSRCLAFLTNCYEAYLSAPQRVRRQMNQAVFERFLVDEDGSTEAELTGAFGVLLAPDFVQQRDAPIETDAEPVGVHRTCDWRNGIPSALQPVWRRLRADLKKPRPTFVGLGSKEHYLVPPAGFEPALPA